MMNQKADIEKDATYFNYLRKRSGLGLIYRNFLLYPVLSGMVHGRVLDFGCGIGDFLQYMKGSVGIDVNQQLVGYCQSLGLDARLIKDGSIPYPDSSFDSVVMDNVLEHIPQADAGRVIAEIMRVLSQSGTLLIGVPGSKGYAADPDHKCFYTLQDLDVLLNSHGCRRVKTRYMPIRFPGLDKHLSQYCIYSVFKKVESA
jgi:SAM-dependent methyltransferase